MVWNTWKYRYSRGADDLHPISNTAKTVGELTHSVQCLKETDVISFKYFREIRDVVEVFFATYTCCAEGQREVICPFSFRTRFSRVTLLFATMSTKDTSIYSGGKKKKEKDMIGWSVWIFRGPKLPLTLCDEPTPKLVVGCQG